MLNANHPDDERLAALASGDPDETTDAGLTAHVEACDRCAELVTDLGALRASLAELPDVAPSRPLRLLPPVPADPAPVDGIGAWVRRLFAPALTAGAALAMVGLVGTASPGTLPSSFEEIGVGGGDAGVMMEADEADAGEERRLEQTHEPDAARDSLTGERDANAYESLEPAAAPGGEPLSAGDDGDRGAVEDPVAEQSAGETAGLPAERSPWPMVLFTGIALIVGAFLLRWILVPRAG